jgi:hypothetical protein
LTARNTASSKACDWGEAAGAAELDGGSQGIAHGQADQGSSAAVVRCVHWSIIYCWVLVALH